LPKAAKLENTKPEIAKKIDIFKS